MKTVLHLRIFGNSKGQKLSLFIILGIALLLLSGIFGYVQLAQLKQPEPQNPETAQTFIESCLRQAAEDSLLKLGDEGSILPQESFELINGKKVYSSILSRKDMERQLSSHIPGNLKLCLSRNTELQLNSEQPIITITIADEKVSADAHYDIKVVQEGKEQTFDRFSIIIPVRLGIMADLINASSSGIVLQQFHDKTAAIVIEPAGERLLIQLIDPENSIRGRPYKYQYLTE